MSRIRLSKYFFSGLYKKGTISNGAILISLLPRYHLVFKVNNRNTGKMCEICSKLTIKTAERRHWLWVCEKEIKQIQIKATILKIGSASFSSMQKIYSYFCFCFILDVCIERRLQIAGRLVDIHLKDTAGCVSFSSLLKTFIFLILTFPIRYSRDICIDIGLTTLVIFVQIFVTLERPPVFTKKSCILKQTCS